MIYNRCIGFDALLTSFLSVGCSYSELMPCGVSIAPAIARFFYRSVLVRRLFIVSGASLNINFSRSLEKKNFKHQPCEREKVGRLAFSDYSFVHSLASCVLAYNGRSSQKSAAARLLRIRRSLDDTGNGE
jgi:hypothetical protein